MDELEPATDPDRNLGLYSGESGRRSHSHSHSHCLFLFTCCTWLLSPIYGALVLQLVSVI